MPLMSTVAVEPTEFSIIDVRPLIMVGTARMVVVAHDRPQDVIACRL